MLFYFDSTHTFLHTGTLLKWRATLQQFRVAGLPSFKSVPKSVAEFLQTNLTACLYEMCVALCYTMRSMRKIGHLLSDMNSQSLLPKLCDNDKSSRRWKQKQKLSRRRRRKTQPDRIPWFMAPKIRQTSQVHGRPRPCRISRSVILITGCIRYIFACDTQSYLVLSPPPVLLNGVEFKEYLRRHLTRNINGIKITSQDHFRCIAQLRRVPMMCCRLYVQLYIYGDFVFQF